MHILIHTLAVVLTLAVVGLAADVFRAMGVSYYTEQSLAALLALSMPLLFLYMPASGSRKGRLSNVPWYDVLLAALSAGLALYVTFRFPALSELVSRRPLDGMIVAGLLILLFLEGLRRTTGWALVIVTATFFILALIGAQLPGELAARSIPPDRLAYYAIWDSSAALGIALKIVSSVVVIYSLFGNALFKSGGSTFFTDLAMAAMGRYRGGPAKIAILGSSLFGTISGNVVSNVLTTGVVTIPLMKRIGFKPHIAGAVEAAASTGGQLMPPVMGVAAFVMAEFLQVQYSAVALAATIPAILFYAALFIQVDLEAGRSNMQAMPADQIPKVAGVLKAGWYFPIPFVVLIWALFWGNYEAEMAGLLATLTAVVFGIVVPFRGKRVGVREIYEMLRDTGLSVLELFMIGAAAGIIIGTLNYSGIGFTLTLTLLHVAGESMWGLLALAGIVSIILGMGMPTVGVYILLATLVAPALIKMDISPMAAHMFILYYGCLSMITPPVAIGAFAAANLAGADPMRTGFASMKLGWTVFVIPFLFVFSDTLLMKGEWGAIALDFVTAIVGVWFVSAGIMGFGMRHLAALERVLYGVAGICVLVPLKAFPNGAWINISGACLIAALLIWERMRRKPLAAG